MNSLEVIGLVGIGFQGILLSLLLFIDRRAKFRSAKVLAILIFAFSLELWSNAISWSHRTDLIRLDFVTYPFILAFGPLFLLYLKLRYEQHISKNFYLHFLPYLIQSLFLLPLYFFDKEVVTATIEFYKTNQVIAIFDYVGILATFIYAGLIWNLVSKFTNSFDLDQRNIAWLKFISLFFTLFVFVHSMYFVIYRISGPLGGHKYILSGIMSVFIYTIGYLAYFKPELIGKNHLRKYEKSPLNQSDSKETVDQLMRLVDEEDIFLDKDISLSHTAEKLNISTHHLSQVINEMLSQSFTDLMNTKRVERAKELFKDPEYHDHKLISIAYSSGFNSKTNFYMAFKKITGLSPSEYRDSIKSLSTIAH